MKARFQTIFSAGVFSLISAGSAWAQIPTARPAGPAATPTAIVGTVADSAGRALSGAAVTIKNSDASSIVTGTLTDSKGKFRIEGLSQGKYVVHVSYLGHKATQTPIELTPQALTANLSTVRLATDVIAVEGVTAEALRSAVTVGVDRNVYSTKNMPAASGGSTTDLLRNVPELDVDVDGNVKLQGSQSVALHINGRPSPMRGEALKNFLQSMPANRVDRVEIVPNPSAKYDPEGIAGIVNIVLKEGVDLGTSGSFSLNADTRGRHGTSASLNWQKGKLTLFGNTSLNLNRSSMHMTDLRQNLLASPTTFFESDARNNMSGHFVFFDGSMEYRLGKLETVYASARVNKAANNAEGLQAFKILDAARNPMSWYDQDNDNGFGFGNSDFLAGVRRIVKAQQHELSGEVRYTNNLQDMDQNFIKNFIVGQPAGTPAEHGFTDSNTDVGEYSAKADYMRPLSPTLKLETGYKGATKGTDYANQLTRFAGTSTSPFKTDRSDYEYSENYHQAYALLSKQFGKVGVQAGARGEIANTDFTLPTGQSFDNEYNNLFPSLNVSFAPSQSFSSRFSYSKRVDRPQPNMLNPGVPSADSLNRFVGNPDLLPKYTHSFTMDFTRMGAWGMMKLAPYYRKTTNNWDYFKEVDASGVALLTWKNTQSVVAYGTNATLSLRAGAKANGFLSVNMYQYERNASNLNASYSADGFRWDISGNGMMTVRPGTMLQGFARYQAPQDMPQGRISSAVFTNLGLRHQFMENKASLNVSVVDPFDVFRFKFETTDATHTQKSENNISIRSLRVGLSYNFGKPPQPTARRPDEQQQTPEATPQIR